MAERRDLRFTRGDHWTFSFLIADDITGGPADLTGFGWRSQIRKKPDDTTVLATWSVAVDQLTGMVTFSLSPAQTQPLNGVLSYDVEETNPSGNVETILSGKVVVDPDVTR